MSIDRNSVIPNKFKSFDIDTSNWPEQHNFIANLPDNPDDFTEEQWLKLLFPNNDMQAKYDEFMQLRRKLQSFQFLADPDPNVVINNEEINRRKSNIETFTNINPLVASLLRKSYSQIEADLHSLTNLGYRGPDSFMEGLAPNTPEYNTKRRILHNMLILFYARACSPPYYTGYLQTDVRVLAPLISFFYDIFTGSNEQKEFAVYTICVKFFLETKLYLLIGTISTLTWEVQDHSWQGNAFTYYGFPNPRDRKPERFSNNGVSPPYLLRIIFIITWLKNLPSRRFKTMRTKEKIVLVNDIVNQGCATFLTGDYPQGLGYDGSIKTFIANFLIKKDPIYVYSGIISCFSDPNGSMWSFDKMFQELEDNTEGQATLSYSSPNVDNLFGRPGDSGITMGFSKFRNSPEGATYGALNINHVNKVYKKLSQSVMYKKKKTTYFDKIVQKIANTWTIKATDLSNKKKRKLLTDASTLGMSNWQSQNWLQNVEDSGFLLTLRPFSSGYRDANSTSWNLAGGNRITLKNRKKGKRKTLKL